MKKIKNVSLTLLLPFFFVPIGHAENGNGLEDIVDNRTKGLLVSAINAPVYEPGGPVYDPALVGAVMDSVANSMLTTGYSLGPSAGVSLLAGLAVAAIEGSRETVPFTPHFSKILSAPGFKVGDVVLLAVRDEFERAVGAPFDQIHAGSARKATLLRFKAEGVLYVEPELRATWDFSQLKLVVKVSQAINRRGSGRLLGKKTETIEVFGEFVPGATIEDRVRYMEADDGGWLREQLELLANEAAKLYLAAVQRAERPGDDEQLEYVSSRFSVSVPARLVSFDGQRIVYVQDDGRTVANVASAVLWPVTTQTGAAP